MQNNGLPNSPTMMDDMLSPPARDAPLYERLKWSHEFDEISHRDVALGRRIGFYKIKSDLGSGNFSKVKLANHQLTKGKGIFKNISLYYVLRLFLPRFVKSETYSDASNSISKKNDLICWIRMMQQS